MSKIQCFITLVALLGMGELTQAAQEKPGSGTIFGVQELVQSLQGDAPTQEELIVQKVNQYRAQNGRRELTLVKELNKSSDLLADTMAKTGQFSHSAGGLTLQSRVSQVGYEWQALSENIYYMHGGNASAEEIAQRAVKSWINSPGHNQNLLGQRSTECGVSVRTDKRTNRIYVVMIYADRTVTQ